MIGCSFLTEINTHLQACKGIVNLYGGINIMFCGDFYQFPPVKDKPLYKQSNTSEQLVLKNLDYLNKSEFGRFLWLQITHCIFLNKNYRQDLDTRYFNFLEKLKKGECDNEDY